MQIDVLLNSQGLLILNKPAGIVTQGGRNLPQPELSEFIPTTYPGFDLAHRTDRFTSGIIVCADKATRTFLHRNWHNVTKKVYLAIIRDPKWDAQTISLPLDGKSCQTAFRILDRKGGYALVMCELIQNGRFHQIRRHLQSIECSIVGDTVHKKGGAKTSVRKGQLLHAWAMRLQMPQGQLVIQAPIPEDFKTFEFNWERINLAHTKSVGTIQLPNTWKR